MDHSSCRHDEDGNAVGSLRLPSQLDDDDASRPFALNWKRADGLLFRMFFHARSKDGAEWAEVGVEIADFSRFKYADCRLRCRVYGRKSEVVVESDREQCRFARRVQQHWEFRVSRRRLEDAQAKCGPLYAEFKLELVTNDRLRYSLSPVRSGKSDDAASSIPLIDLSTPSPERAKRRPRTPPLDSEWSTFHLKVPDVREKASLLDPQKFAGKGFLLRYFPCDRSGNTANFEMVLTGFAHHQRVCFGIKWAVENHKKKLRFEHQEVVQFAQCGCSWGRGCQHKPVNKAWFRVDARKLREFAGGRSVRLVLKLRVEEAETRAASPIGRREVAETPVQRQASENAFVVHHLQNAGPHEPSELPKALEAARAFIERTAAAVVPGSREVPRFHAPIPPPPTPLFAQTGTAGSHSTAGSSSGTSTSISPPAIAAQLPSPASTPELPTIRIPPVGAGTKATTEKPKETAPGFFLPPFEHVQKTTTAKPIDLFEGKEDGGGKESVAPLPSSVAVEEAQTPIGIKQETHNRKQTSGHEQQPHEEQPTKKPAIGATVKVVPGGEEPAEVAEPPVSRKRRPDLADSSQIERPQEKRQRTSEEDVEEAVKRTDGNDTARQGRMLTIVVGGKEFEVERDLLIDESGFFAKKLAKQEDPSAVLAAVISSETMATVVGWMKTKQMDGLDEKARELYKACVESIKRTSKLPNENHATALIFAAEHEDAELLKALDFVWERPKLFRKAMKSPEFDRMLDQRPALMKTIIASM
ncbi:hypothetical protein M3Y99_01906500 [Aphelenchoides fujianensis]|nr:hypothetical protein M3Y99_01906500 [Aphelenchoides fujianensis]